uniref:Uncharacterized protein n=1 Tax=Ciona savignyi TaxID=51511 RepID=H2YLM8_CIOSA
MRALQYVLVAGATVAYLLSFIFAYLNTFAVKGLYYSNNGDVDNKYFQQASPAGIAFGIVWPIIYTWNLAGLIYILVSLCLADNNSPLKTDPPILNTIFFIGYMLTFSITVGWLFAFDREILGLGLALLILAVCSAYVAIGSSCKALTDNINSSVPVQKKVVWPVRIVVQNGLSTLATWLTVATLLNLVDVILYQDSFGITPPIKRGNLSIQNGSTVALVLLLVIILTYFVLDNFVWDRFTRFIFTPYPVLILALSGLIAKLRPLDDASQNLIIASVELGLVVVALITKVSLVTYRSIAQRSAVATAK